MRDAFKPIQVGLEYEDKIVWLKEVSSVVEKNVVASGRTRRPPHRGKIIGYTTLVSDSPNNGFAGCFNRRVFVEDANGIAPNKIFPGVSLARCK